MYAFLLNENLLYKNCPTLLACSLEFQQMKVKNDNQKQMLTAIKTDEAVKELLPKMAGKMAEPVNMQALCITLAYMLRMNELNEHLKEDLEYILSKAPYMVEQMIQMAMVLGLEFKMGRSRKRITAKNVLTLISFSQNLIQGMWSDDDPFLQLPHMDYERLKQLRKKLKQLTLEQYCRMSKDDRKALAIYEDDSEWQDSEQALQCLPLIDVTTDYFVEGEKEIAVGDILTIKIQIDHKNLGDKETLGFVHSNQFPFLRQSSWFLVFTDEEENDFFAMEKLVIKEPTHVKEIKERLSKPGVMAFSMILRNDSYRGFDKKVNIQINVLKEVKRDTVEYNEEDVQASKAPSLMQQMMEMNPNESDDDEEEDEDNAQQNSDETKKER